MVVVAEAALVVVAVVASSNSSSSCCFCQKIPEQHRKSTKLRTTLNSNIVHYTLASKRTDLKFKMFNEGSNITCTINCNCRLAATRYTLQTWFVRVIPVTVNTPHKGDNNNNSNK